MSTHREIDGKHYFWCIWCGKYVQVDQYHNCDKNNINPKTYKGSL